MFACISILFPFFPISALPDHPLRTFKAAPFSISIFMGGIPRSVNVCVYMYTTHTYIYMYTKNMTEGGRGKRNLTTGLAKINKCDNR